MANYKRNRGFQLGTTENKSSKFLEEDSNPEPPDCESDALPPMSSIDENLRAPKAGRRKRGQAGALAFILVPCVSSPVTRASRLSLCEKRSA